MRKQLKIQVGTVLDDNIEFSLLELCRICDVNPRHVVDIMDEGIITPKGSSPFKWRFSGLMVKRVQVTVRLERDLEVNLPGAAMIIELLDELETLRPVIE